MSILSPILSVFNWFKKTFIDHTKSAASVAVTITEAVKVILANPVTSFLENLADTITHTQIPTQIASVLNAAIPKILVVELGLQGLPDNPTEADILAFEQSILKAFNVTSDNSKLYTVLASQIYGIIETTVSTTPGHFADWVNAVEQAYLDYQKDLTANATAGIIDLPVGTILANGNMIVESAAQAIKDATAPNV